ncbi:MAG: hypothetical protein N2Z21_09480 [Candidatus Sumerlaeaceae bacterium]|nr:hypothetical protein [Candidatus Sumerlaeaceae bacterium]
MGGNQKTELKSVFLAGVAIWLFSFCLYGLLASDQQFGYEGEHAAQARAYVERMLTVDAHGRIQPRARGGVVDVGQYVPFALLAHFLECADCKETWERFWYVWVHPFWSAWTIEMVFCIFWMLSGNLSGAAACGALCACGTVLLPYAKFGMETQQTLWATAGFAALLKFRENPAQRHCVVIAFCLVMLILTKITGVTLAVLLAGVHLWWILFDKEFRGRVKEPCHAVATVFMSICLGLIILLLTNYWRYGRFLGGRYTWGDRAEFPFFHPIRWWAFLVSPNKSVFFFSPILVLTLPYWKKLLTRYRELRPFYVGLLILMGFHLSMNTWVDERWWFSRLHFTIPFLALPVIMWWESDWRRSLWKRAVAGVAISSAIVVQLLGASVNYTALAYVIHPSPELTIENLVWNPNYNHLRFNLWVLTSWWSRQQCGYSLPYLASRTYLPAIPPPTANQYDVFPLKDLDTHDFFLLKELMAPDVPHGATVARTALGLGGIGLLVAMWLWGRAVGYLPQRCGAESYSGGFSGQLRGQRLLSRKWPWRRKWITLRIVRGKN